MDIFDLNDRKVAVAQFVYRAGYKIEGNKLYDYPVSAEVLNMRTGQRDLTQSLMARQISKGLMRKQRAPSTVSFPSPGRLLISPAERGRDMSCRRLK